MAVQPISNDDLGHWGEAQFQGLCTSAGMIASKPDRDKMGWDFIVELPPDAAVGGLPLDQRPNCLSCKVQVKTQWRTDDDRFDMTLSAADRLAKDHGPSFVIVLIAEVSEDQEPKLVDCYLIHMLDDNLERVLKRLRQSTVDLQLKPVNEQRISYSPKLAGIRLALSGRVICEALLGLCGEDPQAYVARKGEQLENLGYSAERYRLNMTIVADHPNDFEDMMLGHRPLSLEHFAVSDARFDLPVPIDEFPPTAASTVFFKPNPQARCIIRIRKTGFTTPLVFDGDVFFLHSLRPNQNIRVLIKTPFLMLDLKSQEEISFKPDGDALMTANLEISFWHRYLRLFALLDDGELELELEFDQPVLPRVTLQLRSKPASMLASDFGPLAEIACRGEALLRQAGARGGAMSFTDLRNSAEMINIAYARLFEPTLEPPRVIETYDQALLGVAGSTCELLQADYVTIGGVALAYACRVTMLSDRVGTGLVWRQVGIKPEMLVVIGDTAEAYEAFVADAWQKFGLDSLIVRRYSGPGL